MKIQFSIEEWKKDETRKVVNDLGELYEIVKCSLSPAFFCYLPKDVDPTTCYTYHAHKIGSNSYPVIGAGVISLSWISMLVDAISLPIGSRFAYMGEDYEIFYEEGFAFPRVKCISNPGISRSYTLNYPHVLLTRLGPENNYDL